MGNPRSQRVLAFIGAASVVLAIGGAAAAMWMIRGGFSTRDEPSWIEAFAAQAARRMAVTSEAKKLRAPPTSPELLQEARMHWASHCATCHGVGGAGDTAMGQRLYPRAPDMRAASTQRQSDGELYSAIKNGIRLTGMPAWGEPGDDDLESWGLVAFIRTLPDLTESELAEIRAHLPRTPHELREELEEDEFLRGEPPSPSSPSPVGKPPEHRHE